jgi:hypothetical protein
LQKARVSADGPLQALDNAQAEGSVAETEGQCRWTHSGNAQRTIWRIGCRNRGSVQMVAFRHWITHRLRDRLQKPRVSADGRIQAMDNAQTGGSVAETEGQRR